VVERDKAMVLNEGSARVGWERGWAWKCVRVVGDTPGGRDLGGGDDGDKGGMEGFVIVLAGLWGCCGE
jgi:hypothetical protein